MNRLAYKEAMRKIKWANKKAGLKFNQAEMRVAQEIVAKTLPKTQEKAIETTWKEKLPVDKTARSIKDILGSLTIS